MERPRRDDDPDYERDDPDDDQLIRDAHRFAVTYFGGDVRRAAQWFTDWAMGYED